jgi:transcriptional regulator with XRE-family HTH domain
MGFRENLKQELNSRGMLIKQLAAASEVHKRALDTYLRANASMPPADAAVRIARALGVTVEYLVTGEEPALPKDVRSITHELLRLSKQNRKVVAALVRAMLEQTENA